MKYTFLTPLDHVSSHSVHIFNNVRPKNYKNSFFLYFYTKVHHFLSMFNKICQVVM